MSWFGMHLQASNNQIPPKTCSRVGEGALSTAIFLETDSTLKDGFHGHSSLDLSTWNRLKFTAFS